ncbi:MAG TPA: hypothetical protein VFR81_08470 [Longimicrobium sp.]|nr:hypothetical protein [Longimicrobium sp.]
MATKPHEESVRGSKDGEKEKYSPPKQGILETNENYAPRRESYDKSYDLAKRNSGNNQ